MADLGPIAAYPPPKLLLASASKAVHLGAVRQSCHGVVVVAESEPAGPVARGSGDDKSPLSSLNLNFLKTLTDRRTTTRGKPRTRRPRHEGWTVLN